MCPVLQNRSNGWCETVFTNLKLYLSHSSLAYAWKALDCQVKMKVIVTRLEVDRSIPEEGHFPVGLEILVLTHSCFLPLSLTLLMVNMSRCFTEVYHQ